MIDIHRIDAYRKTLFSKALFGLALMLQAIAPFFKLCKIDPRNLRRFKCD